jgi:DNA repair protein RadD
MVPVVAWRADRHCKEGAPDSLKVSYYAGLQTYPEWVHFERKHEMRDKAERWWARHGGVEPPADVTEALARFGELSMPATIAVRRNGKFHDIVNRTFAEKREKAA